MQGTELYQNDSSCDGMDIDFGRSDSDSLSPDDLWALESMSPGFIENLASLNVDKFDFDNARGHMNDDPEMISSCTTCAGFVFCQNPHKLGHFQSSNNTTPSISIKYNVDEKPNSNNEVEIHQHKKSKSKGKKKAKTITIPFPQTIDNHPLESWEDANPARLPRYASKSHNIFLQIQDESKTANFPDDDEELPDFWQNPSFFLSLPPPDDLPVDDHMAHFLGNRMDNFIGFGQCLSSAYKSLYLLSSNSRVLRHTLFAFVKYLNERDRIQQSTACTMHLQKAIPELQDSLSCQTFDDGHILSVPLLAHLAFWWRKPDVAKAHIKGFYKMLIHAGYLDQDRFGKVSVSAKMPSLVLLMWRLSVRLDHYFGFMSPEEETIPPIKSDSESSRRYITDFIDPSAVEWTECLVVTDQLEDLRNLAVHYNRRATAVRNSTDYECDEAQRYIQQAGKKVIRKIEQLEGNILTAATTYNSIYHPIFVPVWNMSLESFPAGQFLHYTPLFRSLHHRFIEAILVNRATLIHTTISTYPKAGPYPMERLQAAIEICCAFATLKERMPFALQGRGRLLEALLFAGYTFCTPEHVLEYQWIQKRLSEEAEFGHSGASRMSQILDMSWEKPDGTCWDWAKITFRQ